MILTPDNEYAAVLDACVLVPMPLCDTLLRFAEEPAMYRPLWSNEILQEVGEALREKLRRPPHLVEHRIQQMRLAFPEALIQIPKEMTAGFGCIPDPDDRHVLCAAVRGHAHAIVTSNWRHFPEDCLRDYGIILQTPDDFLIHQYHLNPDSALSKLDAQASALRRERMELLAGLNRVVPKFSALIEMRFG